MKALALTLAAIFLALLLGLAYLLTGGYDVAADVPHASLTYALLEGARDRSIARRARSIQVPSLDDPALVALGAEHYAEMCTGCHLAPGMENTELRQGLYPEPPSLVEPDDLSPAEQFWVIKHGIKTTAMPAWGRTHDDHIIWGMVAFLRRLPDMTGAQYETMTAGAEHEEHDEAHDHDAQSPAPGR